MHTHIHIYIYMIFYLGHATWTTYIHTHIHICIHTSRTHIYTYIIGDMLQQSHVDLEILVVCAATQGHGVIVAQSVAQGHVRVYGPILASMDDVSGFCCHPDP